MRNRVLTALIVGLGHVVVVMLLIWVSRLPTERKNIVLDVGAIFFFSMSTTERRPGEQSGRPTLKPLHLEPRKVDLSEFLQSTIPMVATIPPLPKSSRSSDVSPQNEISDVAADVIERARVEAGRAMNPIQRSPSFSPLHRKPHTLEWISQHSHEVIDGHGVPQWVLVQPCESEFLVQKPDCTVERVLAHGILFEYMSEQHDATLQYGGPNAIP
jgi:hypothetical protein